MYVYQLLTEPGEKSTIFTIFGSYADQRHSWLILQVNTSDVLGRSAGLREGGREREQRELLCSQSSALATTEIYLVYVSSAAERIHVLIIFE